MAGKKKKVTVYKMPKAQEGMQMAEGAPQQQGGGQDQMQQLAMQVQQMLEQGAQPQEVVAQLMQGGVPPEVIAQIFVGLGMPQEEVVPMIEQVVQQMQGAQQQASPQEGMAPEGQPMMQEGGEQEAMQQMVAQVAEALQGGANPQEVIAQLLQSTGDPNAVLQLMAAATGADEQTAMEQIAPMVEEVAQQMQGGQGQAMSPQEQMMQQTMKGGGMVPPGYHRMPDGSIMADSAHMDDGGMVTEAMMGAVNPTKDDFLQLKKEVLKKYKGGGDTKGFNNSSTEAFMQNLQGAVSNYVSKNLRLGMVTQGLKELKKFDELPKAKGGADITDQMLINQYGITQERYNSWKTNPEDRKQFVEEYQNDFPEYADAATDTDNNNNNNVNNVNPSIPIGTINGNLQWDGQKWTPIDASQQYGARHYYQGYGPGQRSLGGKYIYNRADKTPVWDMLTAFHKDATGNYNVEGRGELEGASKQMIGEKLEDIVADPSKYNMRVEEGYLTRKGKLKEKPGLFGGRPKTFMFDYVGKQGAPTVDGEAEDVDLQGVDSPMMEATKPFMNQNVPVNPYEQPVQYEANEYMGGEGTPLTGMDEIRGFYMYGGSVSQPGRPIWDFKQMRFTNGTNSALLFAKNGQYVNFPSKEEMEGYVAKNPDGSIRVSEEQERVKDWGKFGRGLFDSTGWLTDKLEAVQQTDPTWESTAERQKMIAATDVRSGALGKYNQWGDWRGDAQGQLGEGVRAGTGTDQDVYGSFNQQNLYSDLMPGQTRWGGLKKGGLVMAQLGLEVGSELELSENDILEMQKYGYHITRM